MAKRAFDMMMDGVNDAIAYAQGDMASESENLQRLRRLAADERHGVNLSALTRKERGK